MKKSKSKVFLIRIFSVLMFIFSTAFTSSKISTYYFSGSCEVCSATGCSPAASYQTGGTECTDNSGQEGPTTDCDLTGTYCEGTGC